MTKSRQLRMVYHVGFLARGPLIEYDADQRHQGGLEGHGLSVSLTPRAWIRIAKLGGRPMWRLTRRDGRRGNFILWTRSLQAKANAFGLKMGLLRKATVFAVTRQLDDDTEGVIHHDTMADALEDVDGDASMVEEATDYLPMIGKVSGATFAQATALGHYVGQRPGDFDGIWWAEAYAPRALSAPRGVILPYSVMRWQAEPCDHTEDEWERE